MAGPLQGLKILDFSTALPGPFATMMMADMGAAVLRVNQPGRTSIRGGGPDGGPNAVERTLHRNKRAISLNLKSPESYEVVRRLVAEHDVLVEQFRPGVMKRLGWDYEAARAVNPKIIYCSLTGYGQNGPLRDRAGHDINYLALSGLMSYSGTKEDGPRPYATQVADITAGSYNLMVGLLAALHHRDRTGEGQWVDIAMLDGSVALNAVGGAEYMVRGRVPEREAEVLNGGLLYDFYRTRDGEFLAVGGLEPKFLAQFLEAIGHPELAEPGTAMTFMKNVPEAKRVVSEAIAARTLAEWLDVFANFDACVEPVLNLEQMAEHPQTRDREMVVDVDSGDGTTVRQIACPIKFSEAPLEYRHVGRAGNADNRQVLGEIGFSEEEIAVLSESGVLG